MKNSKYQSTYPLINILSYIFLICGVVLTALEMVLFFRSDDYSYIDASDKYFMAIMMFLWYVGLKYVNKKRIKNQEN